MKILEDVKNQLSGFAFSQSAYFFRGVFNLYQTFQWIIANNQPQNNPAQDKFKQELRNRFFETYPVFSCFRTVNKVSKDGDIELKSKDTPSV